MWTIEPEMQLCCAVTVSFTATFLVNKPPTVMEINKLVLYQLKMNCMITEEQLANIKNQFLSKKYCSWSHCMCEEVLNPPAADVTKTFIFIKWQPVHITFLCRLCFSGSHLSSSHSSRLSQILTGGIIATFLPLSLNERDTKVTLIPDLAWVLVFSSSRAAFHRFFFHFWHFSTWSISADSTHPY